MAEITTEIQRLAADMLETMYDAPGVGLAAPQVGVTKRLIVMDCIKDGPPEPVALINPEVIWASEDLSTYEEGCLSIPEQYAEVKRPQKFRSVGRTSTATSKSASSRAFGRPVCSTRLTT